MRISDWSSDVCSSDLTNRPAIQSSDPEWIEQSRRVGFRSERHGQRDDGGRERTAHLGDAVEREPLARFVALGRGGLHHLSALVAHLRCRHSSAGHRSEEHTSELQSLMRNSYAVFCLTKKNNTS